MSTSSESSPKAEPLKIKDRVASTLIACEGWVGEIQAIEQHEFAGTLYHVRWDDPGLDDDYYTESELKLYEFDESGIVENAE